MIDRRELLAGAGALALTSALPAWAGQSAGLPLEAYLAGIAEELLADYPENASALGLDNGARAALKCRLTDRSLAGQRRLAERAAARLAQLRAIDPATLTPAARIDLDVVRTAHETAVEGFAFPYGDMAVLNQNWSYRNAPYAVAQNTGAFVEIPDLLDSNHKVENAADAEAYLARLEAYAAALDGETGRLAHDAALGVVAPDFLLDKSLQAAARGPRLADRRMGPGDLARPPHRRDARRLRPPRRGAGHREGRARARPADRRARAPPRPRHRRCGRLEAPPGRGLLCLGAQGRHDHDAHAGRGPRSGPRAIARAPGRDGHPPARPGPDPRHGRRAHDRARRRSAPALPQQRRRPPPVARLHERAHRRHAHPPAPRLRHPGRRQSGGETGAARDRDRRARRLCRRPARSTAPCPATSTSTSTIFRPARASASPLLAFHEGIPGHVWQGEYTYRLPLVRSLLAFNAYSEGWALYAEQLGDELGVYDEDPLGRLGYLQSIAFRACRLVVDTGLHAKRWTRDHAIDWFATTNGSPRRRRHQRGRPLLRLARPGLRLQGRP